MKLHDIQFFILLAGVFILSSITSVRYRYLCFLIGSVIFLAYPGNIHSLLLVAVTSAINYGVGVFLSRSDTGIKKTYLLTIGICLNIIILNAFKYKFYSNGILFIGISYYTLEGIRYLVDVYLKPDSAVCNPFKFLSYSTFFPKLTAGPITYVPAFFSGQDIQIKSFTFERGMESLRLILWGLMKKFVLANNFSRIADPFYSNPLSYGWQGAILSVISFAFQLHFDFSAYTDLARGTAGLLGIDLPVNFLNPFLSTSISDFWRRWHISLSNWFKDMVFTPLFRFLSRLINTGNLGLSKLIYIICTVITFILLGLWHKVSINFLCLGLFQGIVVSFEFWINSKRFRVLNNKWVVRLWRVFGVIYTLTIFTLATIFFRASGWDKVIDIYTALAGFSKLPPKGIILSGLEFLPLVVIFVFVVEYYILKHNIYTRMPIYILWVVNLIIIFITLALGDFGLSTDFIYKQF